MIPWIKIKCNNSSFEVTKTGSFFGIFPGNTTPMPVDINECQCMVPEVFEQIQIGNIEVLDCDNNPLTPEEGISCLSFLHSEFNRLNKSIDNSHYFCGYY